VPGLPPSYPSSGAKALASACIGGPPVRPPQNRGTRDERAYTLAFFGNRDTTGVDREADFPFSKERWHRKVRDAVEDAAARHLQTKAAERQLPGPETVTKRNGLLKLLPRLYIRPGRRRTRRVRSGFPSVRPRGAVPTWDNRREQPRPHCHSPYKFGDPCHLLVCAGAPPAFAAARNAALGRVAASEARGTRRSSQAAVQPAGGRVYSVLALRSVSPTGGSPPGVLGAVRTLPVGLSTRDCLVLVKKAQASQARPRLVYVLTTVQLLVHAFLSL
jgi:hypothetical protein